jgi:hypothetical protein
VADCSAVKRGMGASPSKVRILPPPSTHSNYLARTHTNEYLGAFSAGPMCSRPLAAFLHSSIEVKLPTCKAPEVPSATQIINRTIIISTLVCSCPSPLWLVPLPAVYPLSFMQGVIDLKQWIFRWLPSVEC